MAFTCPSYAPLFYRRYVDDCVLLFRDLSHADSFLNFLNGRHPNIKFTMEKQTDSKLPFLDILVHNDGFHLHTSVYRKPCFSGLGTSFFSYISKSLRFSAISSAIHRAYHLSSSYASFHWELRFLERFFCDNGFSTGTVHSMLTQSPRC